MPADSSRAVFLSYASQDAEAAKRICEALRAAGVEVWFDQNELRGGDAWDQKIRRQIKDCALFVPVVSPNTDARPEGYFRLEWLLAVERARLMADDHPFLFPIAIDNVNEATARVPEKFRDVQWTRVRLDESPADVARRVARLLARPSGSGPAASGAGTVRTSTGAGPAGGMKNRGGQVLLLTAVAAAVGFGVFRWKSDRASEPAAALDKPAPLSPARQLLAKAWVQLNTQELARAELETADTLCKRAAELDPVDAEVWATWTHVHAWYIHHALDTSAARREAARDCAVRAIRLDPAAFESRLAGAIHYTRAGGAGDRQQTIQTLRDLLRERPDEPRCLLHLGRYLMARKETHEEGLAALHRLAANPNFTALAWVEIGWAWHNRDRDMRRALEAANKSIAAKPFWHNLGLKAHIAAIWIGDLDLALETAMQMPVSARQEDWAATLIDRIHSLRRRPADRLRFLDTLPQEWLSSNQYQGPKAALSGHARLMAGATELGRRDLLRAIELIDQRLAEQPNHARLLGLKASCQSLAGDETGARATYKLFRQLEERWWFGPLILFEPLEAVLDALDEHTPYWAMLALDPAFDGMRTHPRFPALLEKLRNDPRFSPHAPEPR